MPPTFARYSVRKARRSVIVFLHLSSFTIRWTVPVPMPSDLATFRIPMPFASCFRTFRSVALVSMAALHGGGAANQCTQLNVGVIGFGR